MFSAIKSSLSRVESNCTNNCPVQIQVPIETIDKCNPNQTNRYDEKKFKFTEKNKLPTYFPKGSRIVYNPDKTIVNVWTNNNEMLSYPSAKNTFYNEEENMYVDDLLSDIKKMQIVSVESSDDKKMQENIEEFYVPRKKKCNFNMIYAVVLIILLYFIYNKY